MTSDSKMTQFITNNTNVDNALDINQAVLLNNFNTIFSYKTFGNSSKANNLLDSYIIDKKSSNTTLHELPIRSGLGSLPLGYLEESDPSNNLSSSIVIPSYGLKYLFPTLRKASPKNNSLKILINISNLDYNQTEKLIVPDILDSLHIANELNYPVIAPINLREVSQTTLFATFLSRFGTTCHLLDAIAAKNTFFKPDHEDKYFLRNQFIDAADILNKSGLNAENADLNDYITAFNKYIENSIPTNESVKTKSFAIENFDLKAKDLNNVKTLFVTIGSTETTVFDDFLDSVSFQGSETIGRIAIRIPIPFDAKKFLSLLPQSLEKIIVIEQNNASQLNKASKSKNFLYSTIQGILESASLSKKIDINAISYTSDFTWSKNAVEEIVFNSLNISTDERIDVSLPKINEINVWSNDDDSKSSTFLEFPYQLLDNLIQHDQSFDPSLRVKYDNLTQGGTFQAQVAVNVDANLKHLVVNNENSKLTIVSDTDILQKFDVLNTVAANSTILLFSDKHSLDNLKNPEYFASKLKIPSKYLSTIVNKNLRVIVVDRKNIKDTDETRGRALVYLLEALFWKFGYSISDQDIIKKIWATNGTQIELLASVISDSVNSNYETAVGELDVSKLPEFLAVAAKDEKPEEEALKTYLSENSFEANPRVVKKEEEPVFGNTTLSEISKQLVFSEAYNAREELRPDLPIKNFVVTVSKNKRVTPLNYDRNIFEIEFDIGNSGLKYEIGEALGVHAKNNVEDVKRFLAEYGVTDINQLVQTPNRENPDLIETRTLLQVFVDQIDLFGKPGKKFYESLITYTKDEVVLKQIIDLISPNGEAELKKVQEEDFLTYADVLLQKFNTVKPPVLDLLTLIPSLKRREYSIASSQKVHPTKIHLLIVVVSWTDSQGRLRYGQASKYLADLSVGTELVVSVKPSVMKLPPRPEQPVIMSGLGTGLAPFKAIVEEKIWQRSQGLPIGEIYLFLGSRHKVEEYLYGELWEAWKDAGIITHIGAAFSRDQPEKIYIQDRIKEVLPALKSAFCDQEGSFYLCGPTWPVPNITEALQSILKTDAEEKGKKINLDDAIEKLKDTGRYILEVY